MPVIAKPIPAVTDEQLARLVSNIRINPTTECHEWTRARSKGYGRVTLNGLTYGVHRVMYALAYGDPAPDMQIDHLCRNRRCANPNHLEVVTAAENLRRGLTAAYINRNKVTCPRGHELAGKNLIQALAAKSGRACRSCDNAARAARRMGLAGPVREAFIQLNSDAKYASVTGGQKIAA